MADVHKLSEQMIDFAERLSAVADAASGNSHASHNRGPSHGTGVGRWIVLPAVGAALYAAIRSQLFAREAKAVLNEAKALGDGAKTRAADLPGDLLKSVRQQPAKSRSTTSSTRGRRSTSRSKSATRSGTSRSNSRRASTSR
jgi:hypothetical protein